MNPIRCRQARRLLASYHDGELTMDVAVTVQGHLRSCPSCLAERRRLAEVGALLRAGVAARGPEERGRLERHVLARLQAERQMSWRGSFNRLFEDLHLVWAAAGATAATVLILCAVVATLALATRTQPLSMAAMLGALAAPGSDLNPVSVDDRMLLPRSAPDAMVDAVLLDGPEGVVAMAAVVTREGRVRNLSLLRDAQAREVNEREALDLLEAASQARFEPARAGGAPVAVNLVWVVARTTVRGKGGDLVWPVMHAPRPRVPVAPIPPSLPVSERAAPLEPTAA
jgi:Putative zinc-finger